MNQLQLVDYPDPHRARAARLRREHPELKRLQGPTWWTPPLTLGLVVVQVLLTAWVSSLARSLAQPDAWGVWGWALVPLLAFGVGAFISHALYAVLHECTHLLAGRGRTVNRVVSLVANLPLVLPMAITYAHFHLLHHRHQGEPALDPDLPGSAEHALAQRGALGKLAWHVSFPFWQLWRTRTMPQPRARGWLALNVASQGVFCAAVALLVGVPGLVYLALSLYFTIALHPLAGRLLQEHTVVHEQQETYSYYGALNAISLNVGYHSEHHDFPAVPWTRLPALRRACAALYDDELVSHGSWSAVWWRFMTDARLGPLARVVRHSRRE
ncbi:MAG: fatty acid desaturase [Sandaracinaceae bacterium]|nr:fatty acid desaturase [Sandaracinaceae bacterium]